MKTKKLIAVILLGFFLTTLSSVSLASAESSTSSQELSTSASKINKRSEYWREVSSGEKGVTQSMGQSHQTLINKNGQSWRQNKELQRSITIWIIPAMVFIILLKHLIIRPHKLQRSGKKVLRFTKFERSIHWFVAITFIVLAITGSTLLLGRRVLIPLLGGDTFAALAYQMKLVHNYTGPVFGVGMLIMILMWVKDNIPDSHDIKWAKKMGGMFSKEHLPVGKINLSEKMWFWLVAILGLLGIVATGFYMNFPIFGAERIDYSWANMIHSFCSVIIMTATLGHIYMGTKGVDGALDGMKTGYVDENWAKEHHSIWYEKVKKASKEDK